ncbi:hypothetical protein VTN96DRAFT_7518 [Rasamsonia emersonii]
MTKLLPYYHILALPTCKRRATGRLLRLDPIMVQTELAHISSVQGVSQVIASGKVASLSVSAQYIYIFLVDDLDITFVKSPNTCVMRFSGKTRDIGYPN